MNLLLYFTGRFHNIWEFWCVSSKSTAELWLNFYIGRTISFSAFSKHHTTRIPKQWWLNLPHPGSITWWVTCSDTDSYIHSKRAVQFFGLFGLSNRASSVIGPNVIQAIINKTGNIWMGFPFLFAICFCASMVIWLCIDVERGRRDAVAWAADNMPGNKSDFSKQTS